MEPTVLAHGGTAGAAFEALFLLVPVVVFAILSRVARRREAEGAGGASDAEGDPR